MNVERPADHVADEPWPAQDIASELRLRPERPKVVRLSRKALALIAGVSALALGGALIFALQTAETVQRSELFNTANRTTAAGLEKLPQDYTALPRKVPQLGPPLPGDLGRPMLEAGVQPMPMVGTPVPEQVQYEPQPAYQPQAISPVDPNVERMSQQRQLLLQEREAARLSRLFAADTRGQAPGAVTSESTPGGQVDLRSSGSSPNVSSNRRTLSADRVQAPASPYVLQSGAVIPAALITGIRSDLPGQVTAQVTENIYDGPTGRALLIPQGSRLVGQYDARIAFGQSRALLAWTRLIMPNGRSIVLERQPGADAAGRSGLQDGVDNHWGQLLRAAFVSTVLSVGAEAGAGSDESDLVRAIRRGTSDSVSQTGRQLVGRSLDVQPTLTIRPGFPVRVIVTQDLVLEPYRD